MIFVISIFIIANLLASCSTTPLANIWKNRSEYNSALTTSEDSEVLLNIVRMHYKFSPYFVGISSITTQSSLSAELAGGGTQIFQSPLNSSGTPFWSISPATTFSISPTVTYSPMMGKQSFPPLITPLDIFDLYLLSRSMGIKLAFNISIDKIGRLDNISTPWSIDRDTIPNYQEFISFIKTLDSLISKDHVQYQIIKYHDQNAILLEIFNTNDAKTLSTLLHLENLHKKLILTKLRYREDKDKEYIIHIQTRSYFNILQFLSYGISHDVDNNKKYGIKTKVIYPSGQSLVLENIVSRLIRVEISKDEPLDSVIKTYFLDNWYYIKNNDNQSKITLMMLRLIYSLSLGADYHQTVPVLTIPVR